MKEEEKVLEFLSFSDEILALMLGIRMNIWKSTRGNASAAKRARVAMIEFEKEGKEYRKKSIEFFKKTDVKDD